MWTTLDILIENGTVLTMDRSLTLLERGFIGISNGAIAHLGSEAPLLPAHRRIDAKGGIIMPGLINAHTHAAMTLFRGLADDLPLMRWLNDYIFPVEQQMDAGFVHAGTMLACAEMIASGTTTFCDMYLFEDTVAKAVKSTGLRCLLGEVLYDFPSPNYGSPENGLRYTQDLIEKWCDDPLISVAVEPHATYTCSPDLLRAAHELATEANVPMVIHLAETMTEVTDIQKRFGKRPVAYLDDLGLLTPNLIADHCIHITPAEMDRMAAVGVRVAHTPESNMKLASGVAPVHEMRSRQIPVALGTDGCASNNNLDLFTEMGTAAKLPKVFRMDPTLMDAQTVLKMATCDAAKVLGMDAIIGSLEVGKQADIIILDTQKPHWVPLYNPYSQIVYSANGADVRHVMVKGKMLLLDGQFQTLDISKVYTQAAAMSHKVRQWLKQARYAG